MKNINVLILIFLITCGFNGYSFIVMNDIVPVFPGEDQRAIENNVIQGAVHFLQAQSQASLLLGEFEKSGKQPFSYSFALQAVEGAISEVEKSIYEYEVAVTIGKRAGYVHAVIQKFKNYNYDVFVSEKGLNRDIMEMVRAYFSGGNIIGAYQQNMEYLGEILITLHLIKDKLDTNQLPDISLFWQLVRQFSRTALFGNYCTSAAVDILTP